MMGVMDFGRIARKPLILSCVFMMAVFLWGCGKSGSGQGGNGDTGKGASQAKSSYSDKAMIGSSTGGSITVETDDGYYVTLDVPEKAMENTREVTLSVDLESTGGMTITIEPSLSLKAGAFLMVAFPDEKDVEGKLICRKENGSPMKQGMEEGALTAMVYRFGEFTLDTMDTDKMLDAADSLLGEPSDESWQNAYETFDSLVWLSDYLARKGYAQDASDCFTGVVSKSKANADRFLAAVDRSSLDTAVVNSLDRYRQLMVLCENPDQIVDQINALIAEAGLSE